MRFLVVATLLLMLAGFAGCGPAATKLPPLAPVKGTVKLDGKPMATGEIVFVLPGMPDQLIPVNAGEYSGNAMIGANSVRIFSYFESPPDSGLESDTVKKTNIVANRFSYKSTLTADVKPAKPEAPNEFSFEAMTR
ncbi:hypothetical protein NA78x_002551 [Anatilimnocola sp. NA78]|uniref:hypothetical protein n=1 Tax=Anatilimnocola sp. NA78 TaxID=3415683 RepID=UPI003CE4BD44